MNRFVSFLATFIFSLAAHAGQFTLDEILIKKLNRTDTNTSAALVMGFISDNSFCLQAGCGLEIEDFSVARFFEDLSLGLYRCKGDFVHIRHSHTVQVFKIRSCSPLNEDELRRSCPPKPNE